MSTHSDIVLFTLIQAIEPVVCVRNLRLSGAGPQAVGGALSVLDNVARDRTTPITVWYPPRQIDVTLLDVHDPDSVWLAGHSCSSTQTLIHCTFTGMQKGKLLVLTVLWLTDNGLAWLTRLTLTLLVDSEHTELILGAL